MASSEFFKNGQYQLESEGRSSPRRSSRNYLADLAGKYPIITIEDGMSESRLGRLGPAHPRPGRAHPARGRRSVRTNTRFSRRASSKHIANAILIKPNQIGTLTETLAAIQMADEAHYASVVSHRSGETEDSTIADIAVATAATQIKTGSLSRSDRMAKYNQLLRIEAELGKVRYAGREAFPGEDLTRITACRRFALLHSLGHSIRHNQARRTMARGIGVAPWPGQSFGPSAAIGALGIARRMHTSRADGGRRPGLRSASALVIDETHSSVLYSRNADVAAPIASITKLLTALVIADAKLPLDEPIQVTQEDRSLHKGASRDLRSVRL